MTELSSPVQLKYCTRCKIEKTTAEFAPQKGGKYGVTSRCRPCGRIITSEWQKAHPDKVSARCKAWRSKNHERCLNNNRNAYARTRSARIESVMRWQKRNPDSKLLTGATYRANHKDALKEWRRKNRGLVNDHMAKRDESKRLATPKWLTLSQKLQMKCIYQMSVRLSKCTGIKHHVDHVHPLNGTRSCGLHVPWNLRAIPARLNLKKKNTLGGYDY